MKKRLANYIYDNIVVKNLITNEILIFDNTKDMANYLNIDAVVIPKIIRSKSKIYNMYEIIHYNKDYKVKSKKYSGFKYKYGYIRIQNIKTKEILIFNNTKEVKEYLKICMAAVYKLLEKSIKDIKKEWILLDAIKIYN